MPNAKDEKFEYFMQVTDKRFEVIQQQFLLLDAKLDHLISFRYKLVGATAAASILISALFGLLELYFTYKG